MLCAILVFAPPASADTDPGHVVTDDTSTNDALCGRLGRQRPAWSCGRLPNGRVSPAPMNPVPYSGWQGDPSLLHQDQAIITVSGQFSWRTANLGVAPPGRPDVVLVEGQTYHFRGSTILPASDRSTFTNDATRHGMMIDSDYSVKPY